MIELETKPTVESTSKTTRLRHILELDKDKKPTDKCLCGYVWDIFPVKHDPNSGICDECIAELRRREGI